jgi:hypothetical protein
VFFARYDPEETASLGITVSNIQVRSNGPQLAEIGRLLGEGELQVGVDSTYPLPEAGSAHTRAAGPPPRQHRADGGLVIAELQQAAANYAHALDELNVPAWEAVLSRRHRLDLHDARTDGARPGRRTRGGARLHP